MKKFITYILLFFAIIAVVDILFGLVCRYLNSHAKGGDTASHYNITINQTDSILILGSSRAIHHYNPHVLEDSLGISVHNCGVDGNGILFQYARLSLILERHTPKMVIYDAIPKFDISAEDDIMRNLKWLRRWHGNPAIDSIFNDISKSEKYKLLSNMYKYNGDFIQMISDNIKPMQGIAYKGYKPMYGTIDYEPSDAPDKIIEWHPIKLKYFKSLINTCRSKDITLVIVYSPWYKKDSSIAYTRLSELCNEYNIPIIDYYGGGILNDSTQFFSDASHLNDDGANAFSKSIAPRIRTFLHQ